MNSPFFVALANHLWQSTLFAVAIGLVTVLAKKNGAQVRHALWLAASLKFLVPFALLAAIGSALVAPQPTEVTAVQSALVPVIQSIAAPVPAPAFPQFASSGMLSPGVAQRLLLAAALVWALGTLLVSARRFRQWRQVRAMLRDSVPVAIEFPTAVRSSRAPLEPAVIGVFRPVLLIPQGIGERLTGSQMHAVLAHERCHVRRRDNLSATLHMMVEALFWFHPLVWWLGARLIAEREQACDEQVLREGHDPSSYAEGILKVCEHYIASRLPSAAGVSGADLKQRIEGIMKNPTIVRLNGLQKSVLAALAVVAVLAPVTAGLLLPPRAQAAEPNDAGLKGFGGSPVLSGTRIRLTPPGIHISSFQVKQSDFEFIVRNSMPGGAFVVRNQTLRAMLVFAYDVNPSRIDGPESLDTTHFDVDIPLGLDVDGNATWNTRLKAVMQAALRARFGLELRLAPREISGYVLRVADAALVPKAVAAATPTGMIYLGDDTGRAVANSLNPLVLHLSRRLDAPVVDETELRRRYNYDVTWGPGTEGALPADPAKVAAALRSQLGLELLPQRVTVPKLTVTSVRPVAEIIS